MDRETQGRVRHSLYYEPWLRERLRAAAKAADRSLNAEVRHRLKLSLNEETKA